MTTNDIMSAITGGILAAGGVVCLSAGAYVACWLLDRVLTKVATTLKLSRLFLVFAVRRMRDEKGLPEPVFIEDCRASVEVLLKHAADYGFDGDGWDATSIAVRNLRSQLNKEMPK